MRDDPGSLRESVHPRGRAEKAPRSQPTDSSVGSGEAPVENMSAAVRKTIQELQAYQAQLEKRNEELLLSQRELAASRDRYSDLYDRAPVGYFTVGEDGVILEVNLTGVALLGMGRDDLIGKPLSRFVVKDDVDAFELHYEHALKSRTGQTCEVRMLRPDGSQLYAHLDSIVAPDSDGGDEQLRTIVGDITARQRAEEGMAQLARQNELILNSAGEGILGLDAACNITFANPAAARMIGEKVEDLAGAPFHSVVRLAKSDRTPYRLEVCPIHETVEYGILHSVTDEWFWRKDETIFPVDYTSTPIQWADRVVGAVVTFRDITEDTRTEKALRDSEERWRSLVKNAPNFITIVDRDSLVRFINHPVPGLTMEDVVGRSVYDFIEPDYHDLARESIAHVFRTGEPGFYASSAAGPHGTAAWYENHLGPIWQGGKVVAVTFIASDVTERKLTEEALSWEAGINAAVADLSTALISMVSLEDISILVLDHAQRVTSSTFGFVGHIDPQTGCLISPTLTRDIWDQCQVSDKTTVFEKFGGLWGWVLENKAPLMTNRPADHPHSSGVPEGHIPIHRFLSAPALIGDTLVGQVALANADRDYTERDMALAERLASLYAVAVQHAWAEEALQQRTHDLGERVKELNCLIAISSLHGTQDISLDEILQGTVDLIPPAWQYPEITCARISLDHQAARTENFTETPWRQASHVVLYGKQAGAVEVYYQEDRPTSDEGPFLNEERSLLDAIAQRLGETIERRRAEVEIRSLARFPSENHNPVLRVAQNGKILYANEASQPLLAEWTTRVGKKLPKAWQQRIGASVWEGVGGTVEVRCGERIISLAFAPVQQAGYVNLYGRDITERKLAEEALRQHAERLQGLRKMDRFILAALSADEIAEAVLRHVRKQVVCKRASVAVFDYEGDELSILAAHADGGTQLRKGWHGPLKWVWSLEALSQGQAQAAEDIQVLPFASPMMDALRAEGLRSYASVPLLVQGELIGSLNLGTDSPGTLTPEQVDIVSDVADHLAIGIRQARLHEQVQRHAIELERRVEERTAELRASEARFRAIFEGSVTGIALSDVEGYVLASNQALERMLGYSNEELRGMAASEFSHPSDLAAERELFGELVAGERDHYTVEKRYRHKDTRVIWANLAVSMIRGAGGEPEFVISMIQHVTEQRQTQAALIQAEKLAVTGRLAASLAHEINNPLQAVIGCLGLAQESLARGDDASEYNRVAMEELRRAARIVGQLRNLHQQSESEEREPADINALMERVLMLSKQRCQEHGIDVLWKRADDLPTVELVPDRVHQVFLNLVLNAVDAMPERGQLQVSTVRSSQPDGVEISFTDSGAGIPPDVLPHVFDPFYSTKPDGLGLGLFISWNIVEMHGGHIEVESEVGTGTTFRVWLPAQTRGVTDPAQAKVKVLDRIPQTQQGV